MSGPGMTGLSGPKNRRSSIFYHAEAISPEKKGFYVLVTAVGYGRAIGYTEKELRMAPHIAVLTSLGLSWGDGIGTKQRHCHWPPYHSKRHAETR